MKTLSLTLLALSAMVRLVFAEEPRLLLAPDKTSISADGRIKLELYLYNSSSHCVTVPSMELVSMSCTIKDVTGKKNDTSCGLYGQGVDHPLPSVSLAPHSVLHKTIVDKLDVQPGNVVELQVDVGDKRKLSSNPVLLFCPIRSDQK